VHGAIYKYEGQISVFNYQDGPTYRCLFPEEPVKGSFKEPVETGLLGVLPGMIGCYQANEVLKIITGFGEVLSGALLSFDMRENNFHKFSIDPVEENKRITGL
jgi:adenylyltransferase/sulfurtransferase